jgi:hypothetical protein
VVLVILTRPSVGCEYIAIKIPAQYFESLAASVGSQKAANDSDHGANEEETRHNRSRVSEIGCQAFTLPSVNTN